MDCKSLKYSDYAKYINIILQNIPQSLVDIITNYSFDYNSFEYFNKHKIMNVKFLGYDDETIFFYHLIKKDIFFIDIITEDVTFIDLENFKEPYVHIIAIMYSCNKYHIYTSNSKYIYDNTMKYISCENKTYKIRGLIKKTGNYKLDIRPTYINKRWRRYHYELTCDFKKELMYNSLRKNAKIYLIMLHDYVCVFLPRHNILYCYTKTIV